MTKQTEALKLALKALENHCGNYKLDDEGVKRFVAACNALKEELAQPEQEPVAFIESKADNECADAYADGWNACVHAHKDTTPPQRPWVGLTDDEIEYWIGCNTSKPALVRAISKALKEKNT